MVVFIESDWRDAMTQMDRDLMNAGQRYFAEPVVFAVRKSMGLIYATEYGPADDCNEREENAHGPFMDLADAYDQCGKPTVWIVEFSA